MRAIHVVALAFVLTLIAGCDADAPNAPADNEKVDLAQPLDRAREVEAVTLEHKEEMDRVLDEQ